MAISKDDTVLTYSKFKEFWTQFAEKFNKKLDGGGIKNNLTTTDEGYVLDARAGKTLNDKISTLQDQTNGIYLATNSAGKWGYKTSKNGAVTPFRNPTGDAVAANVLVGKTFANASSDSLTGTMPNNGSMTATLTPTGNNSVTKTIPAGYTTGGTITANGATAYAAGHAAANAEILVQQLTISIPQDIMSNQNGKWTTPTGKSDSTNWQGREYWAYTATVNVTKSGYTAVAVGMRYISAKPLGTQESRHIDVAVELMSANTVTVNAVTDAANTAAMNIPCYVVYKKN